MNFVLPLSIVVFNVLTGALFLEHQLGKSVGSSRHGPEDIVSLLAGWMGFVSPLQLLATLSGLTATGNGAILALHYADTFVFLSGGGSLYLMFISVPLGIFITWSYHKDYRRTSGGH